MPFTAQEEEDLKKRILALEEEKAAALKREEGVAKKADLDLILADLKEARKELAEMRATKPTKTGIKRDDPDAEDDGFPFNMFEHRGGEGE